MKYHLLIVFLMAVIITAGCVGGNQNTLVTPTQTTTPISSDPIVGIWQWTTTDASKLYTFNFFSDGRYSFTDSSDPNTLLGTWSRVHENEYLITYIGSKTQTLVYNPEKDYFTIPEFSQVHAYHLGKEPVRTYTSIAQPTTSNANQFFQPVDTTPTQNYETGGSTDTFNYILRGKTGLISTILYQGVFNQQQSESKPATCIRYISDPTPCTQEEKHLYYLKYLDEPTQENGLNELIEQIKLKTSNRDDQARIAISLVQNIPYDYANLNSTTRTESTKYPYQVLYENHGLCGEKSLLLAYLLRELGYGVVLFEFNSENHMAVGVPSPIQYSYLNSGYAFIESTSPTIITDSQGDYVGAGKLTSTPQIIQISDGSSMTSVSEEYNDARTFYQVYNQITQIHDTYGNVLNQYQYSRWLSLDNQWKSLVRKYGIQLKTSSYRF